jgi:hypothetical protein
LVAAGHFYLGLTRPLLKPMSLGEYSLEAHLNFVTQGDAPWDGTPLPTQYQTHLSMEPTVGLSETFAIGFMFLSAWEPGYAPQFAGWRGSKRMTHAKSFGLISSVENIDQKV